ncbi:MAG TPA: type II toxin-antitoxin system death-on-curing family toxin [Thermoanaerobaculia bacterium]|nr:type II toxin-antitoxin system death-on-curing family toxin [Thermoanaerobaculia bacterium]
MTVYLSIEQVEELHSIQLRHYGGSPGLRDRGALESAVARPTMTFGGEDLYPDVASKVGALMHSLVMNHPYVDGNKRVGAHAAVLFLLINGQRLDVLPKELEELTLTVARGEIDAEALSIWFRQRISREE